MRAIRTVFQFNYSYISINNSGGFPDPGQRDGISALVNHTNTRNCPIGGISSPERVYTLGLLDLIKKIIPY